METNAYLKKHTLATVEAQIPENAVELIRWLSPRKMDRWDNPRLRYLCLRPDDNAMFATNGVDMRYCKVICSGQWPAKTDGWAGINTGTGIIFTPSDRKTEIFILPDVLEKIAGKTVKMVLYRSIDNKLLGKEDEEWVPFPDGHGRKLISPVVIITYGKGENDWAEVQAPILNNGFGDTSGALSLE